MKKLLSMLLAAALILTAPAAAFASGSSSDYSDLVTAAFSYTYGDEWGTYSYSVPQINWPGDGIQAVNDAIWEQLYDQQLYGQYGALTAVEEGYSGEPFGVSYEWAVNGDVLSLWTVSQYSGDCDTYSVYNISLSANRRITDDELLHVLGMEREDFYDRVRPVLADTFEQWCADFPEDEFKAEQRQGNNAEENVRAVRPYLGRNGALCVVGTVFSLAGAGEYSRQLTILDRSQLPQTISSADLPAQMPIDERLVYFIESSDSKDLSEADIAGFDEQMCVYARNGVYARSGRKFADQDLQDFFMQFAWYTPAIEPGDFDAALLNEYQSRNIALVLDYEAQHGY